jgi:hypothetical protein
MREMTGVAWGDAATSGSHKNWDTRAREPSMRRRVNVATGNGLDSRFLSNLVQK